MSRVPPIRDERGTTMAELLVGMATGMIVFTGLTLMIISSVHTTTEVSHRVEATQDSRIVLTRLIDELDSACIMPEIAPVRVGSSGSELQFVHANGSAVAPTPTLSKVLLEGTTLTQRDYALKSGTAPNWTFEEAQPQATTRLMTGVTQLSPTRPIFSYYAYSTATGGVSTTPLATPLDTTGAASAIEVGVALKVAPAAGEAEAGAAAHIQDTASFRLSAADYHSNVPSLPCR